MNDILNELKNFGIIPVVKIDKSEDALPLAKALIEGGLPVAEITFRTEAAEEVIRLLASKVPELLVGAGTVLSVESAKKAIKAGAKFIVSPGLNPKVVEYCIESKIPVIPGVNNPGQVELGMDYSLEILKFFPAEESGGAGFLKAIAPCYPMVKFIPTGGVNQNNLNSYLSLPNVAACGGSWMVKTELITAKKFDEITKLTKEAIQTLLGFQLGHLGINHDNQEQALETVSVFSKYFNYPASDSGNSILMGRDFEVLKKTGRGKYGHIAIAANDIHRAIFYLEKNGLKELKDSRYEKDGKLRSTFFDIDLAGFAVHLLQK
jgi:2-dehydro-3-deoxyphosphogluconate aldolase / (4S)-4-hydroxy-2-oxoglutarate aldolase